MLEWLGLFPCTAGGASVVHVNAVEGEIPLWQTVSIIFIRLHAYGTKR